MTLQLVLCITDFYRFFPDIITKNKQKNKKNIVLKKQKFKSSVT